VFLRVSPAEVQVVGSQTAVLEGVGLDHAHFVGLTFLVLASGNCGEVDSSMIAALEGDYFCSVPVKDAQGCLEWGSARLEIDKSRLTGVGHVEFEEFGFESAVMDGTELEGAEMNGAEPK